MAFKCLKSDRGSAGKNLAVCCGSKSTIKKMCQNQRESIKKVYAVNYRTTINDICGIAYNFQLQI